MLQRTVRVVQFGLGAIGIDIARLVANQPGLELVGGIDIDERKVGANLGELLKLDRPLDARVDADAEAALARTRPDVVVIATTSRLHEVYRQIRMAAHAHAHVVSTCEELVYPFVAEPDVCSTLDEMARHANVAVLGVGINPGFAMDFLPIVLTAVSNDVRHVRATRVVNASTRRWTLQQRLGVGMDPGAFRDWARQSTTPHIGLQQSLHMIADAFGWNLDQVSEGIEPIIADEWVRTPYVAAGPGQVAGIRQWAHGLIGRRPVIELEWRTAVGLQETYDAVQIDGVPPIDMLIRGGIHGDLATATLVTRAIPLITGAQPGLRTVLDLPILHYRARSLPLHIGIGSR